jgi:hypothetical protein
MRLTSTPSVTYSEINTRETDLYEDAWGFRSEFSDVIGQMDEIDTSPGDRMAEKLITLINLYGL